MPLSKNSTAQLIELYTNRIETLQITLLQDDDPTLGRMLQPALDILRNVHQLASNIEDRDNAEAIAAAEAKHVFLHGPRTKSDPENCEKCNYDDHTCPGCGEWLHHGTGACGPCNRDLS